MVWILFEWRINLIERRPCKQQTDKARYVISGTFSRSSRVNKLTGSWSKFSFDAERMPWMSMSSRNRPCCLFYLCSSAPRLHFKHTGQWDGSLEANTNISLYANWKCSIRSIMHTTKTNNNSCSKVQRHHLRLNLICWIDRTSGSVAATPLRVVLGESLKSGHRGQSCSVLVSPWGFVVTTAEPISLLA